MKELLRQFKEVLWRPCAARTAIFCSLFLIVGALVSTRLLDVSSIWGPHKISWSLFSKYPQSCSTIAISHIEQNEIAPNCTVPGKCPTNYDYQNSSNPQDLNRSSSCPDYYRWIYEDLRPWKSTGITLEMVERAKRTANFRLVIVNNTAYVETYSKAFQSRDTLNLWGILQLLRRYPGKVPDLDLMFDCNDPPVVLKKDYGGVNAKAQQPPPLFKYCASKDTLDIVFPDWSFWGWPEINIKPWEILLKNLKEGSNRTKWIDREPYAYWKGNPYTGTTRRDLLKCNLTEKDDWNARLYVQNWERESRQGFKQSDLASQCTYRYKIYIEGNSWSVSEKYILACDSVTLVVKPHYYDFFTRGLVPMQHYWPVNEDDKCRSIKLAVDWGNDHKQEAQNIGKAASEFIQKDLKMDYVYDYMLHLLTEYAKLLRFKPTIPQKAVEFSSKSMASSAQGLEKEFMEETRVNGPSNGNPCAMPPPYDPQSLHALQTRQATSIKKVESCEKSYWKY